MLSAFKAQAIHELKPKDKAKIESLLAYGDRLLVGLSTGALRIYRVNEPQAPLETSHDNDDVQGQAHAQAKTKVVELKREVDKFSRKPVQQLAIIKESNLLVSLSDGYVSLHDLREYELVERLEATKGATCFAVTSNIVTDVDTEIQTLVSRLAVGVKRRVLCWTWQSAEQIPEVLDTSLESNVKSLVWTDGKRVVVGMDAGYSVVDTLTHKITPVYRPAPRSTDGKPRDAENEVIRFGAVNSGGMGYMGMSSWVPKPMATPLASGQALLAKDVNSLFIDSEGTALEKRQIPWSPAPEAVGFSYPYLLGLLSLEKASLQIRNPDTLSLLQTIVVPGANILHVPQPNISLAHAGKGFLVASDRVIWRMNALPYDDQLVELTGKQRFDEAISLLNLLEETLIDDKAGRIREMRTQKAIHLFEQQDYRTALDLFTDAQTSPDRVISLYPRSISGDLCAIKEDPVREDSQDSTGTPRSESINDAQPATPKSARGKLMNNRRRRGSAGSADTQGTRKTTAGKAKSSESGPLEGDNLKVAVHCLCSFLAQARIQVQKYLNTDGTLRQSPPELDSETRKPVFANLLSESIFATGDWSNADWQAELLKSAQLIYTTLFRAYMLVSPSLAGPLFRLDNFCEQDVVQSSLYESGRYGDLIDFLHGKKLHRQSLEMLAKFGRGEAEGEVPDGMLGPERTVRYLRQLPPASIDLILEFGKWPLQADPAVGIDIFLADTENAEQLPRDRVVDFLAEIDVDLERRYLEHIIHELDDVTPAFHQRLIGLYLQSLKDKDKSKSSDERNEIKGKLESLLQSSSSYDKAETLGQLPEADETFFEARALILGRLGRHKQALSIYVFQLHDYERAEAYCTATYVAQQQQAQSDVAQLPGAAPRRAMHRSADGLPEQQENTFATLLGLYLRPPGEGEEKRWAQALDLLARHGPRLPASSTLALMPDDLGVHELDDYFRGRLRLATAERRKAQVVRALEEVRNSAAKRELLLGSEADIERGVPGGRNRRVAINEDDHCRVCHRRFGASAVRVYPDGQVVHYGCVGGGGSGGGGGGGRGGGGQNGGRATKVWG